jgi:uncharacterized membrane protein YfcA
MITLPIAATLGAAVLATSFISGIFGMAGGMILIGILLAIMPVAGAMVLHGLTQIASNGWRAWLWREHIRWPLVARHATGAAFATLAFSLLQVTPSKPIALIGLGLISLAGLCVPQRIAPNINRPADAFACGAICTVLQLIAGVSGPIFDVFFVRSELVRKEIVATKAAIQVFGHAMKVAYFAQLLVGASGEIAPMAVALAMTLALAGTQLSRKVLDAITDAQFRSWSRALIATIATFYLAHGTLLLLPGIYGA